jgi:hypothetical protein
MGFIFIVLAYLFQILGILSFIYFLYLIRKIAIELERMNEISERQINK